MTSKLMNERIKHFIYPVNTDLNDDENLRVYNRSSHDNIIHQIVFQSADKCAKTIVKDLFNTQRETLLSENMLNVIAEENEIKEFLEKEISEKNGKPSSLSNPEMIYRSFNFAKPATLLPIYQNELYLIKQIGETETGEVKLYLINPFFFAFKLSFDLFIIMTYFKDTTDELVEGLLIILEDKYGSEFVDIFNYVSDICYEAIQIAIQKGDEEGETLIKKLQEISGIVNDKIHYEFIYNSSFLSAISMREKINKLISE
jgi:hypothetical protein